MVMVFVCSPPHLTQVPSRKYFGHSALVSQVRFTSSDEYLLSAGGEDYWWVQCCGCSDIHTAVPHGSEVDARPGFSVE